jgi:hypothetical protein
MKMFDEYNTEPSSAVWEKISHRLDSRRRRKRILLFLSSFIIAALTGYVIFQSYESKTEYLSGTQKSSNTQNELSETNSPKNKLQGNSKSETNLTAEKSIDNRTSELNSVKTDAKADALPGKGRNKSNLITEPVSGSVPVTLSSKILNKRSNQTENVVPAKTAITTTNEFGISTPFSDGASNKELSLLSSISPELPVTGSIIPFKEFIFPVEFSKNVLRWTVGIFAGITNNYHRQEFINEQEQSDYNQIEKNIQRAEYLFRISYDISGRLKLSSGVGYYSTGGTHSLSKVVLKDQQIKTYLISSPGGDIIMPGNEFDQLILGNDSSLFPSYAVVSVIPDTVRYVNTEMLQEYSYIRIPVSLSYSLLRSKIYLSPGAGLSVSMLNSSNTFIRDNRLAYNPVASKTIMSLEMFIEAGISFSKNWSFSVLPAYRHDIKSINHSDVVKWYNSSLSISGGITYRIPSIRNSK